MAATRGIPTTGRLIRQASSSIPSSTSVPSAPVGRLCDETDIYLDYAATTPVDPAVARVMNDFLTVDGVFGNPTSTTHGFGHAAAEAVETARREVAALLSSRADEIVWTSGATEAINLALKGAAFARCHRGRHVVTSPLEHKAVLDSAKWLESQGFSSSFVELDETGAITPENLSGALRPDTVVVSLMLVNNETGAVTDIAALAPVIHEQGALLHVDAVQGAARLPLDNIVAEADLITISAHKMYGPKGIGALRVRTALRSELVPLIHGGGHEFGLRSGTLPTHQIAGMGEAARLVRDRRSADANDVAAFDHRLRLHLDQIPGVAANQDARARVPGILNVHIAGVEAESLMLALKSVAISSGSACTSANIEPSHVLLALGHDPERALSSVRFSFGRFTTMDEIDRAGRLVGETVTALRRIAK